MICDLYIKRSFFFIKRMKKIKQGVLYSHHFSLIHLLIHNKMFVYDSIVWLSWLIY